MSTITPPGHILLILRRLKENGHAAFLVGGCVRDAVMGRPMRDWDIATSAAPLDVARLFREAVMIGAKFGTVTVVIPRFAEVTTLQRQASPKRNEASARKRRKEDILSPGKEQAEHIEVDEVQVTTFRTEDEYLDGRHPAVVEFVATLDEDLSRRDFTINAMACSIMGKIIDLFGGQEDIGNKLIRCVGDPGTRFSDDALRMFRAFRFRAELGFEIEVGTMEAVRTNAHNAAQISSERIRDELDKTLMSQRPETAGEIIQCGLLDRYLISRFDGDLCLSLRNIALLPASSILRWCAFTHALLEKKLIVSATRFLRELHIDDKTVKTCSAAMSVRSFPVTRPAIKRLMAKHGTNAVRCAAAIFDVKNESAALDSIDEIVNSGECFSLHDLAVSGKDLLNRGYTPGPEIGKTLDKLLRHVIERPEDNSREVLLGLL